MRDLLSWNISLGRYAGVQIRLHVFFILFALVAVLFGPGGNQKLLWETAAVLAIFLASVLAHELGHCVAACRTGGTIDQVVLWPLGGLTQINPSHDPHSELFTAIAGPFVNFAVCLLTLPVLMIGERPLPDLLNPLLPPVNAEGLTWLNACEWMFWTNWLLSLVSCLPALPFDGGRVVRAFFWTHHDFRTGVVLAARVAQFTAVGLWIAAALIYRSGEEFRFATLPCALVGMLLFFAAKQEIDRLYEMDSDDAMLGYDFSQGYTSLEKAVPSRKAPPSPVRKWLDDRRAKRIERQRQLEADEERRVDEVLARLHQLGMHSLSEDERALLNRVSARYRNRLRP